MIIFDDISLDNKISKKIFKRLCRNFRHLNAFIITTS